MTRVREDGQIKLDYPRTYRASRGSRAFSVVFGGFLAVPCLLGLGVLLTSVLAGQTRISDASVGLVICFGFALVGIHTFLDALRAKVVLFEDRIEIQKVMRRYVLLRADIAGRRLQAHRVKGHTHHNIALVPRQAGKDAIELENNLKTDSFFKEWVDSLDDLDA